MMESEDVRTRCDSYLSGRSVTLKGLGKALESSYPTLHRVEKSEYQTGKKYKGKPSWNRKFQNKDFPRITKTMKQIRDFKAQGDGKQFSTFL